jgi:Rod binding domain-containing protein
LAVQITSILPLPVAIANADGPLTSAPASAHAPRAESPAAHAAAQEFEAFVLQSFIEAMLPRNAESVFGSGTSGAFWKSMLAEQLAKELTRSGGVGIARLIAPDNEQSGGVG